MLVLATATSVPNWSISGSFSNCGAPPDSVIADAIVTAPTRVATAAAAKAAKKAPGPGGPDAGPARAWKTARLMTPRNR